MSKTNFPKGFPYGVSIKGVPLTMSHPGGVLWVHSVTGSNGNTGKLSNKPLATIDYAVGLCTASKGDVIIVMPGHVETLTTASALAVDVIGVKIIGLGSGNDRPQITLTPATAGVVLVAMSAASTSIENVIFIAGLDAMTTPILVSAAGVNLDIEWRDGSATVETATAILTTAAADNLNINLKYIGFPAGNACVSPIQLVGCNNGYINLDFHGLASTAVVEFVTTLSNNIEIYGYAFNSTDTTGVKLVVDTVTNSVWYASIDAGAAGAIFSGGSGATLASDDASVIAANQTVPTADATTNTLERDVVGNKTDAAAAVGTTKTLVAYAKQNLNQIGTITNTGGTASLGAIVGDMSNVDVATRMKQLSRSSTVALAAADITGTTTRWTVTGPILVKRLGALITTVLPAGANTLKLSFTPTGGSATDLCGATDTASAAAQQLFLVEGVKATVLSKTTDVGIGVKAADANMPITLSSGVIQTVLSAGPPATGAATLFMEWEPLIPTATVA